MNFILSDEPSSEEEKMRLESFTTRFGRNSAPIYVTESQSEVIQSVSQSEASPNVSQVEVSKSVSQLEVN